MTMQAMILAAGFGTRLKPYSLIRPKPLFPLFNRPLLPATVRRLQRAGFTRIIVNCHHLGELIEDALAGFDGVQLQKEPVILGTGGGLRLALESLGPEPLLVTNGDIYHDLDFQALYGRHGAGGAAVTMALHDQPRFNSVETAGTEVVGFSSGTGANLAYTGIQVVEPEVLRGINPGRYACIIDYYRHLLATGAAIRAEVFTELAWTDIGTPADYLATHAALLRGRLPIWPELAEPPTAATWIAPGAEIGEQCRIADWACIGAATIGAGAVIERSVIWDGARVEPGAVIRDQIIAA